jgi:hypothetical protein
VHDQDVHPVHRTRTDSQIRVSGKSLLGRMWRHITGSETEEAQEELTRRREPPQKSWVDGIVVCVTEPDLPHSLPTFPH